ncbi:uncharacterized protein VTP21DRAFT_5896 [Calcarisporiella thermophila]|uniref:uncharacterized protein n=1 Tax=Calcarisporiella thermophila TaxID=911321 RepID=UPI0037434AB6
MTFLSSLSRSLTSRIGFTASTVNFQQLRSMKVRSSVKKMCDGCSTVRRRGRVYTTLNLRSSLKLCEFSPGLTELPCLLYLYFCLWDKVSILLSFVMLFHLNVILARFFFLHL